MCTAGKENWTRNCECEHLSSRKTCPAVYTSEQRKPVKENLRKKTCSLYTWASKATKEHAKENVVVCTGGQGPVYTRDRLKIRPGRLHTFVSQFGKMAFARNTVRQIVQPFLIKFWSRNSCMHFS